MRDCLCMGMEKYICKEKIMNKKGMESKECKFNNFETVQGIFHEFCQNPKMLECNKVEDGKKLTCMGSDCNCWERKE